MRRALLAGAAIAVAVAAAVPLWLVLDNNGGRRAAALQEPTGTGDIGRLTLVGKNGGNPIPVRSFSVDLSRHVEEGATKREVGATKSVIQLLRRVDNISPVLFEMGHTETQADGKLDVGADKPYLQYSVQTAALAKWSDSNKAETLQFEDRGINVQLLGTPPTALSSEVTGRMKIPSLSDKTFPIVTFDTGFERELSEASDGTRRFATTPSHDPASVKRAIDALAPQLFASMQVSTPIPEVVIELIAPGTATPYATYLYKEVHLNSLSDSGAAGSFPTQSITFVYDKVEIKTQSNSASSAS